MARLKRIPDKKADHAAYLNYHRDRHVIEDTERHAKTLASIAATKGSCDATRRPHYERAAELVAQAAEVLRTGWEKPYIKE